MKDINVFIGKRIKEYREYRNYTQEYMSKELEIAPNHYGRIERGENSCVNSKLVHICNILAITPNELFGDLIITSDDEFVCAYNKLALEDKLIVSKFTEFLLSKK
ncbi:MAG: helix-turn-helix transcriptional regulator, partial [Bacilli bacterium]